MTYTYGPVASWRYGRSLGVDVTTPPKKCTFNCIYCQLGQTEKHVRSPDDVRDDLPGSNEIVQEVRRTLEILDHDTVDAITFSGTGEPTLNPQIGKIESNIRNISEDISIILLTNASLLPKKDIRKGLVNFDIVTAKFDAGDEDTFRRINHPAKDTFNLQDIKKGIKNLHGEMKGILALEVMLLTGSRGLTNVEGPSRKALIEGIIDVNPDIVQIYTPWRPSSVQTVKPVSNQILQEFGKELEEHLGSEKLWVYGIHDARGKDVNWKGHHIIEQEILELLKRRPCRISDIAMSLGLIQPVVTRVLGMMQKSNIVRASRVGSDVFYEATSR